MQDFAKFISRELVTEVTTTDKNAILSELVGCVAKTGLIGDSQAFLDQLIAREAESSTGIGRAVAIPHARPDGLKTPFVAVGRSHAGIDFDASDGGLVHLVFLIGATSDHALYLGIIARISWLVRNERLRQQLLHAEDADALFSLLAAH